ncbi:MAG: hypothetical protein ACRCTP_14435 [Aeromonas popoffii]|uniref:hypothetical protein n=1 Tax=Aeromonas popoffii TaxID=70856 RepID=UPI003F375352
MLIHEEKNPPEWRVYRVKKDQIGGLARYVAISSAGIIAAGGPYQMGGAEQPALEKQFELHGVCTPAENKRRFHTLAGDTLALAATVIAG